MHDTDPPPRTPAELAAAADRHRRHRAAHPLPPGWTEDPDGLYFAARDDFEYPDPVVLLTTRVGSRGLQVEADYYHRGAVATGWYGTGDAVPPAQEVERLLFELLGLRPGPDTTATAPRRIGGAGEEWAWAFDVVLADAPPPATRGLAHLPLAEPPEQGQDLIQ